MDNHLPWVEKYRPKNLAQVDGNSNIKRTLSNYGGISSMPHLLFYGPPGTGKTSTILAMAKQYYGTKFKSMVLELNASDDREINVVRGKINTFCQNSSILGCNDVKLVILDECDATTVEAQSALRRIIEKNTKYVRFCLCCNYVDKIIPSLKSRCTKFKFRPIDTESLKSTAMRIIENESINITKCGVDSILNISNGDARKVINILQSINLSSTDEISSDMVYKAIGIPNPIEIENILNILTTCGFKSSFDQILIIMNECGYSLADIVTYVTQMIMNDITKISIFKLENILSVFSDVEYNLSVGASDRIQLGFLVGAFHIH